jgi:hypothetical protein
MKVKDENRLLWIRIRTKMSRIHNTGKNCFNNCTERIEDRKGCRYGKEEARSPTRNVVNEQLTQKAGRKRVEVLN